MKITYRLNNPDRVIIEQRQRALMINTHSQLLVDAYLLHNAPMWPIALLFSCGISHGSWTTARNILRKCLALGHIGALW